MLIRALVITLLAGAANMAHSQDGKTLFATCGACHGPNGEGVAAMNAPALAGQSANYLARQLTHFKSGLRGSNSNDSYGQQMKAMAATLPDQAAIEAVTGYIAALPRTYPVSTVTGDAELGYKQYNMKCGACHGANAEGNEGLNSPALIGVGDAYLQRQLANFRSGQRGTDASDKYGRQMRMMANTVNEKEVIDILSYLNTLK